MSDYLLKCYFDGRVVGTGEYDSLYDAIKAAGYALCGSKGPSVEEFEITTNVKGEPELLLVYGYNEDTAAANAEAEKVVEWAE